MTTDRALKLKALGLLRDLVYEELTCIARAAHRHENIGRLRYSYHCSFFKRIDSCESADYGVLPAKMVLAHSLGGARPEKKRQFSSSIQTAQAPSS
ncbi:hypothetical protein [Ralstonia pickettii]|uniref:hypothetical protein n=1 Tax=Ralstonia pickettii TaxID=329 RepID=UPI0012680B75|nr:hypothetical protein [Ralstonia pickettii]